MGNPLETAWFYKYEPKTIEDYVFENEEQANLVWEWIQNEKIPGNLLLYGPPGTGKTALAKILIRSIIKSPHDLLKISSRSVAEIDNIYEWIIKKPVKSKTKIIYFEEFDKISKQAMYQLKDELMEKYQSYVSFIATTNHIKRIDSAVLTRFNYKFELAGKNAEYYFYKCAYILDCEGVKYIEDELRKFVEANAKRGLRDIINILQICSSSGTLVLDNADSIKGNFEDELVELTLSIFAKFLSVEIPSKVKAIMLISPLNSEISKEYSRILEIVNSNYDIDYESVFEELFNRTNFIPVKAIINNYVNNINNVKFQNIAYISFIYECSKCLMNLYM